MDQATVTFTGDKAALLDLLQHVDSSTLVLRYETSFEIKKYRQRCPWCKTGAFTSYRNLAQHLQNKHNKTLDSVAIMDDDAAHKAAAEDETNQRIVEQVLKALRVSGFNN